MSLFAWKQGSNGWESMNNENIIKKNDWEMYRL